MANPTLYIDTGGSTTNSGSTDVNSATVSSTSSGFTASVTGSVVTFSGNTDLSGVLADGSQTIYINDATNSNRKIFQITAVDDGLNTVTVAIAPTGTISTSTWAIGGRHVWTKASIEALGGGGWNVQFNNSVASSASTIIQTRVASTSATGFNKYYGKAGTRPVLNCTSTQNVITAGDNLAWFENLELVQGGASQNVVSSGADGHVFYNIKVSDGGAAAFQQSSAGVRYIACEMTGTSAGGFASSNPGRTLLIGNYIHDLTGNGIELTSVTSNGPVFLNNIVDTCTGRGIHLNTAVTDLSQTIQVMGNTIYGNGNSGLEVSDIDWPLDLMNNIFMNNGATTGSGAYNVEWTAGTAETLSFHKWNLFYQDSTTLGTGAANLLNLTVDATELTSDPLFTDAPGGNFAIGSSSPAKATGFPGQFLGGSLGYLDMGAVQIAAGIAIIINLMAQIWM